MPDDPSERPSPNDEHLWEVGCDGHQRAQPARMAKSTLKQKIEWLEQAHKMVLHLQAQRASRGDEAPGAEDNIGDSTRRPGSETSLDDDPSAL